MVRKGFDPGSQHGVINLANAYPVDLNERAATGRLMGERALSYLGVNIEFLGLVSEAEMEMVSMDSLRSGLYEQPSGRRISNLAVNETEYLTIVRNAEAFTESVRANTDRARLIDPVPARRETKSEDSIVHAVKNKQPTFEGLMQWLNDEYTRLQLFRKEIETPHLSHMKDASLRQIASSIWEFSFGNILDVVAHQKGWDQTQLENAKRAILERMTHGKQQDRQQYWIDLTNLAIQYNRNRRSLFNTKMNQAKSHAQRAEAKARKIKR